MSAKGKGSRGGAGTASFSKIRFNSSLLEQARSQCWLGTQIARKKTCPTQEEYDAAMESFIEGLDNYKLLLDTMKNIGSTGSDYDSIMDEFSRNFRYQLLFAGKVKAECQRVASKISEAELKKTIEEITGEMDKLIDVEEKNDKPPFIPNPNYSEEFERSFQKLVYDRTVFDVCNYPSFDTYAGAEHYKNIFEEQIILPIQFARVGSGEAGHQGIILYGPPGTGKTSLVRTLAGELAKREMPAILIVVSGSDLKGRYYGDVEKAIRILFEEAAKYTSNGTRPVVVFIDEADTIFGNVGEEQSSANASAISEFKTQTEPTDIEKRRLAAKISIFLATNYPERLSKDLLSRFERNIYVPDPTFNETRSTILVSFKEKIGGWENLNFATEGDASIYVQRIDLKRKDFIWTHKTPNMWQLYEFDVGSGEIPIDPETNHGYWSGKRDSVYMKLSSFMAKDNNKKGVFPTSYVTNNFHDYNMKDHVYSDAEIMIKYAMGYSYDMYAMLNLIYEKMKGKNLPVGTNFGAENTMSPFLTYFFKSQQASLKNLADNGNTASSAGTITDFYKTKFIAFMEQMNEIMQQLLVVKSGLPDIVINSQYLISNKDDVNFSPLFRALLKDERRIIKAFTDKNLFVYFVDSAGIDRESMAYYFSWVFKAMYSRFDVLDILTLKAQQKNLVQRNINRWIKFSNIIGAGEMKRFVQSNIDTTGVDFKKWLFVKEKKEVKKTIYANLRCEVKQKTNMKWIPLQKSFISDIDDRALKERMQKSTKANPYDPYKDMIENFFMAGRMKENKDKDSLADNLLDYMIGKMWGFKYDTGSNLTYVSLKLFNNQDDFTKDYYSKIIVTRAMEKPTMTVAKEYNSNQTNYGRVISNTVRHYELPQKLKTVTKFDYSMFFGPLDLKNNPKALEITKSEFDKMVNNIRYPAPVGEVQQSPVFQQNNFIHNVAIVGGDMFPKQTRLCLTNLIGLFSSYFFHVSVDGNMGNVNTITGVPYDGVAFLNAWYLMQFATKKYDNPIPSERIDDKTFYASATASQLTFAKLQQGLMRVNQQATLNYDKFIQFAGGEEALMSDIYLPEKQLILTKMQVMIKKNNQL